MKKIFLTGAGSGIGLETARLLLASGHEVWGTSRTPSKLPASPRFHPVALDLSDPGSIEQAWNTVQTEAGFIDVLINNAGSGSFGLLEDIPPGTLQHEFQILVHGPARLVQLALPAMRQRRQGTIINVTSLAALFPLPGLAPYSAAKAALASLTRSWRIETAGSGVRILDLQPGDINTGFHHAMPLLYPAPSGMPPRAKQIYDAMADTYRHAPGPESVARLLLDLVEKSRTSSPRTAGHWIQRFGAPLAARILPNCWIDAALRWVYRVS
jgi:NAD(P)-dependent dehydrogenase (short-subunit alcohol dehydrogenase family)